MYSELFQKFRLFQRTGVLSSSKPYSSVSEIQQKDQAISKSTAGCVASHHIFATLAWTFSGKSAVTPLEINSFLFVLQKSTIPFWCMKILPCWDLKEKLIPNQSFQHHSQPSHKLPSSVSGVIDNAVTLLVI